MEVRYLTCDDFCKLIGNRWKHRAVQGWLWREWSIPTDVLNVMAECLEGESRAFLSHRLPKLPCYDGGWDNMVNVSRELRELAKK
jgi:hypothetical protein